MTYQEMEAAIAEANHTMNIADSVADRIANLLIGRLAKVNTYALRRLKRELQNFDMTTGRWK